ncbi:MAG: DUF501 domain-containing protein [Planctomycetota bacterium]
MRVGLAARSARVSAGPIVDALRAWPLPSEEQVEAVGVALGRAPRGSWKLLACDADGAPAVLAQHPWPGAGAPATTLYWLVAPGLRAAAADLERRGGLADVAAWLAASRGRLRQLEMCHRRYAWTRWLWQRRGVMRRSVGATPGVIRPGRTGVGGIERWRLDASRPPAVKCLHAHLAQHLAEAALLGPARSLGLPANPVARWALDQLGVAPEEAIALR